MADQRPRRPVLYTLSLLLKGRHGQGGITIGTPELDEMTTLIWLNRQLDLVDKPIEEALEDRKNEFRERCKDLDMATSGIRRCPVASTRGFFPCERLYPPSVRNPLAPDVAAAAKNPR